MSVSGWSIAIVAASLVAWLVALVVMADMDHGPGTPLHALPLFLIGWVLMLTAMMLPSELTYIGAFAALVGARGGTPAARTRTVASFIAGYGLAWVGFALVAYGLDAAIRSVSFETISWYRSGHILSGSVLITAGLYQVSSLKEICLHHCRSPLADFARYWRDGDLGAVAMGVRHGVVCVGCCWALMAVMFVVGAMNLAWMALLTLFMFAEKVLPHGQKLALPIASFLIVMGLWIAISPDTVPFLKDPLLSGASFCRTF